MRRSRLSVVAAVGAVGLVSAVMALAGANPAQAADTASGGRYNALTPVRILDTRPEHDTDFPDHPCFGNETQELQVKGAIKNIPDGGSDAVTSSPIAADADAGSVALNVTTVGASGPGWITVWGDGAEPNASSLNYVADTAGIPNMVVARIGADGKIRISANFGSPQTTTGCPNVIVDLLGWYENAPLDLAEPDLARPLAGGYRASTSGTPRVLDSRPQEQPAGNKGCLASGTPKLLDLTNAGGTPPTDVQAVVLNVTVVNPSTSGWLTVWPNGEATPNASNLNYVAGQVVPNMVVARLGTGDQVKIQATTGCPHVVVDVVGWFQKGGPVEPGTLGTTAGPTRIMDTRPNPPGGRPAGSPEGCIGGLDPVKLKIAGNGGIPGLNAAHPPAAVLMNVTAVDAQPGSQGYITIWPTGTPRPITSSVNYKGGPQAVPNFVIAKVGTSGEVSFATSSGCPHVVVDVVGWQAAADPALTVTPSPATFAAGANTVTTKDTVVTVKNSSAFIDPSKPVFTYEGTDKAQFSTLSTTCPTGSTGLAIGAECTVTVRWTPGTNTAAITDTAAQLKVTSGLGVSTIELDGTRSAAI